MIGTTIIDTKESKIRKYFSQSHANNFDHLEKLTKIFLRKVIKLIIITVIQDYYIDIGTSNLAQMLQSEHLHLSHQGFPHLPGRRVCFCKRMEHYLTSATLTLGEF